MLKFSWPKTVCFFLMLITYQVTLISNVIQIILGPNNSLVYFFFVQPIISLS